MKTYWISRNGGPSEGPYELEQLASMWQTGQLTSIDFAAESGTGEWFNVAYLMAPAALEPIKARRRRHRPYLMEAALVAVLGLMLLVFFWPLGVVLMIGSILMDRTIWDCGQCGDKVHETTKVCPKCGAHLRFEWVAEPKAASEPPLPVRMTPN